MQNIVQTIYPEILVLIALVIAIVLSTTKFKNIIWLISTVLLLSGALFLLKFQVTEPIYTLNGMFILDPLSATLKFLTLTLGILIIIGSVKYMEGFVHKSEFLIILLASILGIMFLISANDLITLFVALETLSLSSIMLAGYAKYDLRSNEASLKYLLNSASASAVFLFGLSLLYGVTGSTQFDDIKYKLLTIDSTNSLPYGILALTLIFIIGGLAFKLASAPFHMWSPDVYEGSPTPVTAFLSTVSKVAAFAITLRILIGLFNFLLEIWQPMIIFIAVLSMVIGNFVALGTVINKSSIKRLMAYSSIAQVGYILIGLALATPDTISASVFYLIIYSIMNIGAFLCIIAFGNESNSDLIPDYSGLSKAKPLLAFAFCICLLNLAGIPVPPAGFIAKFILFKASFEAGGIGIFLASIGLLTTILSIFYYSYVVKLIVVDKPSDAVESIGSSKESLGKSFRLNTAIAVSIIAIFIISIISNPILQNTNKIAKSTFSDSKPIISYK